MTNAMLLIECRDCGHTRQADRTWTQQVADRLRLSLGELVKSLLGGKRRLRCDVCRSHAAQVQRVAPAPRPESGRHPEPHALRRPYMPTRQRCKCADAWAIPGDDVCTRCLEG
jgi:hypothetical protein